MSDVIPAEVRERFGRLVRAAWVAYCVETGDAKPSHVAPWDELSEWDKEADRRIADAVLAEAGYLRTPGTVEMDRGRAERLIAIGKGHPYWRNYIASLTKPGDLDPLP